MSDDVRRSRINWPSTLTEVGLILLGLLLAFSADRFWENKQERLRESDYLARLHDDLVTTAASLDSAIVHQDRVLEAGREILDAAVDPNAPGAESDFAAAIPTVFDFRSPTFVTATYDDLLNSGNLGLVRDQELRTVLAEFDALLDGHIALGERVVLDEWIHRVRPILGQAFPAEVYQLPEDRSRMGVPTSPFSSDLRDTMESLEFWNLVTHRLIVADSRKTTFIRARDLANRLVALTAS